MRYATHQVPRHPLGMQRKIINPAWFPWSVRCGSRRAAIRSTSTSARCTATEHRLGIPLAEVHDLLRGGSIVAIGTPLRQTSATTGRCEGEDWPDDADSPARGTRITVVGDDVHCQVQLTILRGLRHEGWLSASLPFPPFYSDACLGACYEDHVKELAPSSPTR